MKNKIKNYIKNRLYSFIDGYLIIKKDRKINKLKSFGQGSSIQEPFYFTGFNQIEIGEKVSFAAFVHIWGEGSVKIGNNVMKASHTAITSITHNPKNQLFNTENICRKVVIGNNVWIGAHTVIFPGVKIGDNCIIGAGAIINKNIPEGTVYAGVPAKELYKLNQFNSNEINS